MRPNIKAVTINIKLQKKRSKRLPLIGISKTVTLSSNIDAILNMERNKYGTILAVIMPAEFP
jgi:hypothetical protein